jgi:hypothetical protein
MRAAPRFLLSSPAMPRRLLRAFAAVVLATAAGCLTISDRITVQPDATLRLVVDRLGPSRVRLRWPPPLAQGPVTVYAGLSPGAIDYSRPLANGIHSIELTAEVLPEIEDERARLYYALVTEDDRTFVTAASRSQGPREDDDGRLSVLPGRLRRGVGAPLPADRRFKRSFEIR